MYDPEIMPTGRTLRCAQHSARLPIDVSLAEAAAPAPSPSARPSSAKLATAALWKGCGVVASASALKWSVPRSNRSPATRRRSGGKGASTRKGVSARASDETDNPGGRGGFKPVPILSKSKWTGVVSSPGPQTMKPGSITALL